MGLFLIVTVLLSIFFSTIFCKETYTPDAVLSVPKIIKRHGYPSETHIVETNDGYLMEVHRIPHGKNTKQFRNYPVYLQHGILASSADWIINGPSKALAYQLADRGFDVWLGNSRGNTYSRSHRSLSSEDKLFWNFSFHEMGIYDIPASIDYILEQTNRSQLYYVGHSMGTCIFFVMCSMRPEYNYKIRTQISLAPVAYVHHMTSMLNSLVPYANQIQKAANWFSNGAFLPQNSASRLVNKYLCGDDANNTVLCKKYIIYNMFGEDSVQFDMKLLPLILAHNPAGTSAKTLMHFAQEIKMRNFQQYDYGIEENIEMYNCSHPPSYNLSSVTAPVAFYFAQNDILAHPDDVMELYARLPNRLSLNLVNYEKFNHVDFMYSRNITELVYQSVINTIFTAELVNWVPIYDNTSYFIPANKYVNCKDEELNKREPRGKTEGFWDKLMSFMKIKKANQEIHPLITQEYDEADIKSRSTVTKSWSKIFHLK